MHRQANNERSRASQRQEARARRRRRSNGLSRNSGAEAFVRPYVATAQLYFAVAKLWLLVLCYGDLLLRMSRSVGAYGNAFAAPAAADYARVDGAGASLKHRSS
jgi:hypothetical protein